MNKRELLTKKVAVISLGCDKNTVDAEKMLFSISDYGFQITGNVEEAEIAIINTCAFLSASKKESIDRILETALLKSQKLEKLIVTGCLPQRNYQELVSGMPEVDRFVRIKSNGSIVKIIEELYSADEGKKRGGKPPNRVLSTPKHYAYLKISDGCSNFCSFCTIPFIRGRYSSTPIEKLLAEAKALVKKGVKELILVAQDVTNYGNDLYGKPQLVLLLQQLSRIKKLKWIRLHYCYPNLITDELLAEIVNNKKICKYLDIPLQHISDSILTNMGRKTTAEDTRALLTKIRSQKEFISLRSTFIVGFPQETEKDFEQLKEFLKEYKLNNVGFFKYSREENTRASKMAHQVSEPVKQKRLKEVMELQEEILKENQEQMTGRVLQAVCEGIRGKDCYIFRTEYNSPTVDTVCFAESKYALKIGEFYNIKITGTAGVDLKGEII